MTININRMGSNNLKGETAGRYYVLYTKNEYPLGLRATYMGVLPDEFGEDSKYIFKLYANEQFIHLPIENFVKKHEYLQNDNEWFAKRVGGFSRRNGYGRYYEEPNNSMNSNSNNSSYAGSNSNGVGSNSNGAGSNSNGAGSNSNGVGSNSGIDPLNEDPVRNSQANDPMSGGTRRGRKKRNVKSKSRKSNRKSRKNRS
jgi:hypothetical protein